MYFIYIFNVYGKYLSYATPKGYVACLGAQVFKFPWRVIFGGFLAEGVKKPKGGGGPNTGPQGPKYIFFSIQSTLLRVFKSTES